LSDDVMMTALMTGRWKLFWTERSDSESAEDATSDDYCRNEMEPLTAVIPEKEKTMWGTVTNSSHILRRWQNIVTKLPGVTG
jgi:hypothetical protein